MVVAFGCIGTFIVWGADPVFDIFVGDIYSVVSNGAPPGASRESEHVCRVQFHVQKRSNYTKFAHPR